MYKLELTEERERVEGEHRQTSGTLTKAAPFLKAKRVYLARANPAPHQGTLWLKITENVPGHGARKEKLPCKINHNQPTENYNYFFYREMLLPSIASLKTFIWGNMLNLLIHFTWAQFCLISAIVLNSLLA